MLALDQLRIGNKYSYDDFSASVRDRKISAPTKKKIKETVPFSNITYDFSAINGEIYWEERTLEYTLEMDARTAEELEKLKVDFKSWVMNIVNEKLYDPFITDYHFLATFDGIDFDDSEFEKTTISLKFTAYPYMIANTKRRYSYAITKAEQTITVKNNSAHKIAPTFISSVPASIEFGNIVYSMDAAEITDESIKLEKGENVLKIKSTSTNGTFTVEFVEEVF